MKKILVYGDSNTWGHNPSAHNPKTGAFERYPEHVRWPSVMQDELGDEYKVIEEGYCGRTTVFEDPVAGGRNGYATIEPIFLTADPVDLVIVMLGTNDTKDMFGANATSISAGMGRLIKTIKNLMAGSNSPDAKILLVNPARLTRPEGGEFFYGFSQNSVDKCEPLRDAYKALADMMGLEFFDADLYGKADPLDGTHLTPESHKALGIAMAQKVREIL